MTDNTNTPAGSGKQQREALAQAEKKAAEQQPESFKDEATADKVVEVGPDITDQPIKGIDPSPPPGGR